tara:strand:- start:527 stop:766 length:240 start_codon:yes stop_codon:yes gene_type:complete
MPDLAPEEPSFFGRLVDKFKDAQENRENHKKFKEYTFEAIADGILEDDEIDFLDQKRKELLQGAPSPPVSLHPEGGLEQ